MRMIIAVLVTLGLVWAVPVADGRPGDDTQTRGLFIGSRPRARKPVAAKAPRVSPTAKDPRPGAPDLVADNQDAAKTPVGVGFSLFQVVSRSRSVRVDPSATFGDGDAFRFVIEPGIDGYLYLFVRTGDEPAVMIYPDYRLDEGDNFVYAHTLTEVPSRRNSKFDLFRVTGGPATEHVFIVISRDPLPKVPIGDELVRYCANAASPCPWTPAGAVFQTIAAEASAPCHTSVQMNASKAISAVEDEALTRKIVLGSSDDQPSIVAVNDSADVPLLVRSVAIRHE